MADLKEIIEINISRETRGVTRQGFGTPLFIGTTPGVYSTGEYVRAYTSANAVLEDFGENTPEHTAALRVFGQQISPTYLKIGNRKQGIQSVDFTIDTVADGTAYSITIDETPVEITSGTGATAESIVGMLEAEFTAATAPGTFVDNEDGTFTVVPEDPVDFTYDNSINIVATADTESLTEAFSAIKEADDDFYFVSIESHSPADIEEIADVIEAESKIFVTSYNGSDATDPTDTQDIGSVLQAKDLARTMIIYAENPDEYPEMAFVGLQAPKDPGSTTWKFKTVSGVTVSRLTTTQSLTLKGTRFDYGKGYNTYENFGGRNILSEGRMVNGEFCDVIRFADFLEARMRERIYLTLVNSEKIPFTAAGFAIIEGRIREVLQEGVAVGGLTSFNVTVPNPRTLDPNLRANRVAEGFEFVGVLSGSVHFVSVSGKLTI